MLDKIKGKRNQRIYADALMKRLTEKLMDGWNPWIEASQPLEYTKWDEVLLKYREYLLKLFNEHNLREESLHDYTSKVNVIETHQEPK